MRNQCRLKRTKIVVIEAYVVTGSDSRISSGYRILQPQGKGCRNEAIRVTAC